MNQFWDQRYGQPGYFYGTEPNDFLRAHAGSLPPGPVLALAEGQGRNAVYLATLGHAVTAVDASPVGLAKAQELAAARGVKIETRRADLADYAFPAEAYSAVICIFGHLPPAARARMHGALRTTLVPGGVFLAEYYRPEQLARGTGGPPDRALLVSAAEARAELRGLELLRVEEVERDVQEGSAHSGPSATLQILARRPAG